MQRHFLIALTAAMLTCAGGTAVAADNSGNNSSSDSGNSINKTYTSMDANQDGKVDQSEFTNYYDNSGLFDTWDADGDGYIDNDEFGDGLYGYYDDNGDGYIDDAEWQNGVMVDDRGDNGFWDM
ncbi:hypothetical protein [Salinisphaera sp.]|uniref:hypothetical protein n=1 Tax=Salinisphaera sp. TaxID=1914330 RepID=UPI002D78F798|nr:hypothetical protein [Salinisphaera sp.]HET7315573.1 hypothetical protein [Salinisphaera sp.]